MTMPEPQRPAVFFDRDGTLMEDVDYCRDPATVRVFDGVPSALGELKGAGFLIVVVTNQSGIGRGLIRQEEYDAVHREFLRQVGPGRIDATYYCPHRPDAGCGCRKPLPGLIERAVADLGIARNLSWMVGDKRADIGCGLAAGLRPGLVLTGYGASSVGGGEEFVAKDVVAAVGFILKSFGA
jgi:D-glycero-D-manno-heptose 1,7-bisphosphate phosphatase